MSKITDQDRKEMVQHLRTINKGAINANAKHSKNIQKQIDLTTTLVKYMGWDKAKIERLERVVDMKQREVDDLNKQNTDLLWDLSKLQFEMGKIKQEHENNEKKKAQYEKIAEKFYSDNSVDN
jgi:hypothetical protein|tara:strand:+ start:3211 stop:3579 length:369 start_codon:yes stop_codon:yes gene_type:complete